MEEVSASEHSSYFELEKNMLSMYKKFAPKKAKDRLEMAAWFAIQPWLSKEIREGWNSLIIHYEDL